MEKWNIYEIFKQDSTVIAGSTQKDSKFSADFSLALYSNSEKSIEDNQKQFMRAFPKGYSFISFKQVHSNKIINISEYDRFSGWLKSDIEADGVVTTQKGVVLTTFGADCLSLLMYDKVAGVIGAAHSGWRGSAKNIAKELFKVMQQHGAKAEQTLCAITPGIRGCCYEVGQEVVEHFKEYPSAFRKKSNGKFMFDNAKVNYLRLLEMGFKEENIELSPLCTACNLDKFFSYRKEGTCSGRFINYIALTRDDF